MSARALPSALALGAALLAPSLASAQRAGATPPAVVQRARLDPTQGVNFHAVVLPDTVYVGEQATYQVGVFLDDDVRARLRRNPEFVPPEMRGMLAYELPTGHAFVPRPGGPGRYEVHVFERAVFPLAAGTLEIPGATLNYSLPLTTSFFSREESYSTRAQRLRLVAVEPPRAGRPPDWDGAVGDLEIGLRLDASAARVGDPLVVTVRVRGEGNVNLFPRPRLQLAWGSAVASDERVRLDSAATRVRGEKEFDWIVTPRRAGRVVLPAVRYPYFDPRRESYQVAQTAPETLSVAPGTLAALDTGAVARPLPVRRAWSGERAPAPGESPWYWLAAALLPLPAGVLALARQPRRRVRISTAATLRRLAAERDVDPRQLRRHFLRALAERVGRGELTPVRRGTVARVLRREGVSPGVADAAEALLHELDVAAYGEAGGVDRDAARRAVELYERVNAEARRPRGAARARAATLAGLLIVVGVVGAARAAADDPATAFAHGVRRYDAGDYAGAQRAFHDAARAAPRAPDAWANLGTASWAVRDTARAVQGWQRALRLEPLAEDVRARLDAVPVAHAEGASVARIPPAPLQWAGLLLWGLAWVGAAARAASRRPPVGQRVAVAGALALFLGAGGTFVDTRLAARDLAVVGSSGPMRAAPAMGAEPRLSLAAGEVVRVERHEGAWTRVIVDGDRTGWVERDRVLPLARH